MVAEVERGREAYERQAWSDAFVLLDGAESLAADDLERLAVAAHLVGRDNDSARAWEMAYRERTRSGDTDQAARCAFWLAFALLLRGEMAPAGGWLARAERLVDDAPPDNATKGLLLLPPFLTSLGGGDHATARALAEEMVDRAERSQDDDLLALGLLSLGEALLAGGNPSRGMKLFDEAMVAVSSGEVSPVAAGIVYCAVIDACMRACDLRRAAEWTDALSGWCAAQPDLVPYRGQCLVHRSQVLLAHGAWADAISEIDRARRRLSDPVHPALGLALYQQG